MNPPLPGFAVLCMRFASASALVSMVLAVVFWGMEPRDFEAWQVFDWAVRLLVTAAGMLVCSKIFLAAKRRRSGAKGRVG